MNLPSLRFKNSLRIVALSALPLLFLEVARLVIGAPISISGALTRWLFIWSILLLAWITQPIQQSKEIWSWPWTGVFLVLFGIVAGIVYESTRLTIAAWVLLAVIYILLINFDTLFERGKHRLIRHIWTLGLALAAGIISVTITEFESHFADEEFFVALQALTLTVFWLLLRFVFTRGFQFKQSPVTGDLNHLKTIRGLSINPLWVALVLPVFAISGIFASILAYQHSFYPDQAPPYEGITEESPFLCGQVQADQQTYNGERVFQRMLALAAKNPNKSTPDLGMLALGSEDIHWAEAFHNKLLDEARQGLFTHPANSVKSVQYEASLRAYYYPRVLNAFPGLFTPDEQKLIRQWFEEINQRSMTVEWVDWMYALAYDKWPAGPYENQESGAGLLALLETQGLADPRISPENKVYLAQNPRGWLERFRVTDDAIVYQTGWLYNAFAQSLYTQKINPTNMRNSFEWLLAQALPDGMPLRYNHVASAPLAGVAYWAANLLKDPRYIWLSGRSLDYLEADGKYFSAVPGAEQPIEMTGHSPTMGSCLIYGDSGLPNQVGPLAPDKIVFRNGWSKDSTYLLLNLRFTGWHRYKATNTVTLMYQDGPLAGDNISGKTFGWLPTGRSLFRDKRIPRENLNGFLVGKTGMSAVLYTLTGVGGSWAQDPPYYATVKSFKPGDQVDVSTTVTSDWRGWNHNRTIYFYHDGPIVFLDQSSQNAQDIDNSPAALVWHLIGGSGINQEFLEVQPFQELKFKLRETGSPAEVLVFPFEAGEMQVEPETSQEDSPGIRVQYQPTAKGTLSMVTIFLTGKWAGGNAKITQEDHGTVLKIVQGSNQLELPLPLEKEGP